MAWGKIGHFKREFFEIHIEAIGLPQISEELEQVERMGSNLLGSGNGEKLAIVVPDHMTATG